MMEAQVAACILCWKRFEDDAGSFQCVLRCKHTFCPSCLLKRPHLDPSNGKLTCPACGNVQTLGGSAGKAPAGWGDDTNSTSDEESEDDEEEEFEEEGSEEESDYFPQGGNTTGMFSTGQLRFDHTVGATFNMTVNDPLINPYGPAAHVDLNSANTNSTPEEESEDDEEEVEKRRREEAKIREEKEDRDKGGCYTEELDEDEEDFEEQEEGKGGEKEVPQRKTKKRSFKGAKVAAIAGVAGGALAGAAAPVVVVAGVQLIGFGAGGIVAGSAAAGIMSASAVAGGGSIAAGGMVATLQAIGATGSLAVIGGPVTLVVGGVVLGGAACAGAGYGGYRLWNWAKGKLKAKEIENAITQALASNYPKHTQSEPSRLFPLDSCPGLLFWYAALSFTEWKGSAVVGGIVDTRSSKAKAFLAADRPEIIKLLGPLLAKEFPTDLPPLRDMLLLVACLFLDESCSVMGEDECIRVSRTAKGSILLKVRYSSNQRKFEKRIYLPKL